MEGVENHRTGVLTLYQCGSEPDAAVYSVLRRLPRSSVPEILAIGRWNDQAYEVAEEIAEGTLADARLSYSDLEVFRTVVREIGQSLHAFSEASLRHRDLRPSNILVRSRDPLDLVIIGFGSARLSEYDLDIVAPLETTRYMAPEAIAGGVASASDWWSLGMILLEGVTNGACFDGVNEKAFLIHVVANGVTIPSGLESSVETLLRGLLARDRSKRWQWDQIRRWASGELVEAPPIEAMPAAGHGPKIQLRDRQHTDPRSYALAAGLQENWDTAREQLLRGELATWAEEVRIDSRACAGLREVARQVLIPEDFRLAIALKLLNRAIPLVHKGEIINPGWLLAHPSEGFELVSGLVPDLLARYGIEGEEWLALLKTRAQAVRARAHALEIQLDEDTLRIHLLGSSRAQLAAIWDEKRRLYPDTEHAGLVSIIERGQIAEEDLVVLVTALPSQFRPVADIVSEAATIARSARIKDFEEQHAAKLLGEPRRALFLEIERRLEGFARTGLTSIDEWADQYRLERRMPLARALVLLAIPPSRWQKPTKQRYVSELLGFFAKKVAGTVLRGPLVRMTIGKTTARVDLTEFHRTRDGAAAILNHLLARTDRSLTIDPTILAASETLKRRIRGLNAHSLLYRRDTGIDGLYLGFPFIVLQEKRGQAKPRIAPIMLWPIRLTVEVGSRGNVKVAFDRDREEVRLNPAFDGLLGIDTAQKWRDVANDILQRSSLKIGDVVDAFGALAGATNRSIAPLPSKDSKLSAGQSEIVGAAVLFHVTYFGQAIGEDLQKLKKSLPSECALTALLRVTGENPPNVTPPRVAEGDKFLAVECDPSQEAAVLSVRDGAGILIEGPPGTGKSQTIVNVICDAIGRGQSLLVVCQKLPALEVVKKRLEAEGLADRIVMVTDTFKDRQHIIRAVRAQQENLSSSSVSEKLARVLKSRQATARQIEALETFIDLHHHATHHVDQDIGKSYRDILSDLIDIEQEGHSIDVPALRALLSRFDQADVQELGSKLAPLIQYWLPAHFEDSPLVTLKLFSPDSLSVAEFLGSFDLFVAAEKRRLQIYDANPTPFAPSDPISLINWLRSFETLFRQLTAEALKRAGEWLPLHKARVLESSRIADVLSQLSVIEEQLVSITPQAPRVVFFDHAHEIESPQLQAWAYLAKRVASSTSAAARLWPPALIRRSRVKRLIASFGYDRPGEQIKALQFAFELEIAMRLLRERYLEVRRQLGLDTPIVSRTTPQELVLLVRDLALQLRGAIEILRAMDECPFNEKLEAAVSTKRHEAVAVVLDQFAAALKRYEANKVSLAATDELSAWMESDWTDRRRASIRQQSFDADALEAIGSERQRVSAYQMFRLRAKDLDVRDFRVLAILRKQQKSLSQVRADDLETTVRRILQRETLLAWKSRLETKEPSILASQQELRSKIGQLEKLYESMRAANREVLIQRVDFDRLASLNAWNDITRLTGPRTLRLREFIDRGADLGLMALRPVWLMNPDSASRVLPLKQGLFDLVVYDEASQMPVEYALPTLYRAKQATVSGDEKQMPPTSFFSSKVESDEAEIFDGEEVDEDASDEERRIIEETWNRREIKDCPDLLHLARASLPSAMLMIHYRSVYRELIDFSNASFYGRRLNVPMRHPDEEIRRVRPIQVVRVDGIYEAQTNRAEAQRVVEILGRIWKAEGSCPSVGVVTFNRKQADLIEEQIEERAEGDAAFRDAYTRELERTDDGEDMGVFVKNVENVQGDERDIIVFSTTFGRAPSGAFRRSFGVLGQTGGERRLNVAVTRARRKIVLVTSMPIADISDFLATHHAASKPRDYLQAYLAYAELISSGNVHGARQLARRMALNAQNRSAKEQEQDGFALSVSKFISSLGLTPEWTNSDDAFGFDFAITDKRTGQYGIAIECDAPKHPLLARARDREIWRPKILKKAIPNHHRVSSVAWYQNGAEERARLEAAIQGALGLAR